MSIPSIRRFGHVTGHSKMRERHGNNSGKRSVRGRPHASGGALRPAAAMMASLRKIQITDLVVDMRYNGGSYVDIASQLAFMVSSATSGKVFEPLQFNNTNPFPFRPEQMKVPLYDKTPGYSAVAGSDVPQLGLSSVTVLTGPDTSRRANR